MNSMLSHHNEGRDLKIRIGRIKGEGEEKHGFLVFRVLAMGKHERKITFMVYLFVITDFEIPLNIATLRALKTWKPKYFIKEQAIHQLT